jgi:polynucleotide 5'-hydroxyl-kinase GRC3/NOL9
VPDTPADLPEPEESLRPVVADLAALEGVALFAGMSDTGKTTLIGQVARAAVDVGRTVAVVDADIGQSTLGPPAAVGMQIFRASPGDLRMRRPQAMAFVGMVQPAGFHGELIAGVTSLVAQARDGGATLVLIDTTGLAPTPNGLKLKADKIMQARPDRVVLLERLRELYPLAQLAGACSFCEVLRVPAPARAHAKPQAFRRGVRKILFEEYFHSARLQKLTVRDTGVRGGMLLTGRPLKEGARLRVAEILRVPVLRAEALPGALHVVTVRAPGEGAAGMLQQRFPNLRVRVYDQRALDGLLIGLEDGCGKLLDMAIIRAFDFTNLIATVLTPYTRMADVKLVHLGAVRLMPDGSESEHVRPGSL